MKAFRYYRLIANMLCGGYGTLDELFQGELRSWKHNGFRSAPVEYVDTWVEPGRVVDRRNSDSYSPLLVWEPGESFPDEDATVLRFMAMELT